MTASSIRVLLVDDQVMVRDGISVLLTTANDIQIVGQAGDGAQAVTAAAELHPDVIVMDIRMPVMDGLEATETILAAHNNGATDTEQDAPRILILTTFDHDDYVYDALSAGASGFMLKDASTQELVDAVRIVARGDALLAPSVTRRLIADVARSRRQAVGTRTEAANLLTPRELDVLRLVARGLSNAEVATGLFLAEQTIKTHVGHILTKLNLRDRTQAVVFAYENGIAGT